jgi:hypothetical protein
LLLEDGSSCLRTRAVRLIGDDFFADHYLRLSE